MKRRLLLICALALLGFVPLRSQEMTITIADGTTATPAMPFVNNTAMGWSQSIYTASMINLPSGGSITAIAFECSQLPTTAWDQPEVTIYMANTSMTAAANNSNWLLADTMTQVYNGTNAEATAVGWHTITLTNPFEYTGGNLAIVVSKNGTTGSALRYKAYNADPAVNGSAMYKTNTNTQPTATGSLSKNLPNIKITMVPNAACMPVENLAATSSTAGMNLSWTVNAVSTTPQRYEIEYGLHGFTIGEGTTVVTTDATPSYTITGLEPMSNYDVYVRAICDEGDTAPAVMLQAYHCIPVALPWNWQTYASQVSTYISWNINNELPGCWEFPGISTTAAGYPRIWASSDGTYGLHFQVRTNSEKPAVIVFPEIDARLSDVAIGLTASYGTTPFPVVQYGYLTNLADTTSFIALGDFVSGDNYKAIRESGVNPPDNARLALRVLNTGSANLRLSDIRVEEVPACQRPSTFDTTRITTTSITLGWTGEHNAGDSYLVYLTEYDQPDNVVATSIVSAQEKMFTGLAPVHSYDAYVTKVCGTSVYSDTLKLGAILTYGSIQLSSNNNLWGTVSGATSGPNNSSVNLYATPAPHYHFVYWLYDNTTAYTSNPLHQPYIYRADNPTMQAVFEPDTFNVVVTSHDVTRGTAAITTGAARMAYGSTLTVAATPAAGYNFQGWSDGSTANPYTFLVERDVTLTAIFATNEEVIAKCMFSNPSYGTVTASTTDTIVPMGTNITYTVTMADPVHYSLTGWRGLLPGTPEPVENPVGTWTVSHTATASTVISPVITPNMYDIVLNVTGTTYGNITPEPGMHTYEFGSQVVLFAQPNANCQFNGWSDNNTSARRTLTISGDLTLAADFSRDSFDVNANINVAAAGTVTVTDGDGNVRTRFAYDETAYLSAVPNLHYSFGRWTDGRKGITSAETHFRVYKSQSWTAIMGMDQFTIIGMAVGGDGSVTPASMIADYNSQVTLTANDGEHYVFYRWEDGNTDNPRNIIATETRTYRAEFTPRMYTIATADDGHGTVTGASSYPYGSTATLTATPADGYHFDHWTNSADETVPGGATINMVVNSDETYTAHFALIDYTVQITAQPRGELNTGNIFTTTAHTGDSWTVTATSVDPVRYVFKGWSDNSSMENPRTFTVTNSPIVAEAIFAAGDEVSVIATASPAGSGTTTYSGTGSYLPGDMVTMTATANDGWQFKHWMPGMVNAQTYNFIIVSDTTLTAVFEPVTLYVTVTSNDPARGGVAGSGTVEYDGSKTVTATPAAGYHLTGWTINGVFVAGTSPYTINNIQENTTVVAEFEAAQYTVTLAGSNVTLEGAGSYDFGAMATIKATPDEHYDFVTWDDGNTNAQRTVMVTGDVTYTAIVAQHEYTVTLTSDNLTMGTVTASMTKHYGETATYEATPYEHYEFVSWENGGTTATKSIEVTKDTADIAYFAPKHYTVTLTQPDVEYGTLNLTDGDTTGGCVYGTVLTFTASENDGMVFDSWLVNGMVRTANPLTVVVQGNTVISANYEQAQYHVVVATNNNTMGTATGTGYYTWGQVVTPVATVSDINAYRFVSWSDGETALTHSDITVNGDMNLTAVFCDREGFVVSVVSNNESWGTATVNATRVLGNTTVTITATAAENCHFVKWSDDDANAVRDIVVTDDVLLTAIFAIDQVHLAYGEVENGAVSGADTGMYDFGSKVTFYAAAADTYHFTEWQDGVTDNPRTVILNTDSTFTPTFARDRYTVTTYMANGTVTEGGEYDYGTTVTLTATPDANYLFGGWTRNGVAFDGTETISFTVDQNVTFVAQTIKSQHNFNVVIAQSGTGYVDGTVSGSYDFDAAISVTAMPALHYHFVCWNNDMTMTDAHIDTTLANGDVSLTAYFAIDTFEVSVVAAEHGSVNSDVNGYYNYGDVVMFKATPDTGYVFANWDNDPTSTENPMAQGVYDTINHTAYFALATYTLTVTSNDNTMGTASIDDPQSVYNYGDSAVIRATCLDTNLYKFLSWNDGETSLARTIYIYEDVEMMAIFGEAEKLTVVALSNNGEWGSVTASESSVNFGDTVTLTAAEAEHYHLMRWSDMDDTMHVRDIVVESDTVITAIFVIDTHTVTLNVEGNGTVYGDGTYDYGTQATIYATADEHSHFMRWSDSSTVNPRTVVVESDTTFTAVFASDSVVVMATAVNGNVNIDTVEVAYGDTMSLVATGAEHYSHFMGWTRNGMPYDGADSIAVVATENATFVATYAIDTVVLAADVNNRQWGYVDGTAAGEYPYGTEVTLVAVNLDNSHFIGWFNANDSTMADTLATVDTLSFTLTADSNVMAVFAPDTYVLDITSNDTTMGTVTGAGVYYYHDLVIVEATPNEGYIFAGWSDSVATPSRYFYVESDTAVMAIFTHEPHTVTVVVNDSTLGTVIGAGLYNWGDTATLTAIPNENSLFVGFNGLTNGVTTMSFVVTEDTTVTATFEHKPVRLYVQAENGSVDVTIAGAPANTNRQPMLAHYDDEVTLTAVPDEYFSFVEWQTYVINYDTTYDTIVVIDSVWPVSTYFGDDGVEYTVYDTLSHIELVPNVDTLFLDDSVYYDNPYNFNITYDRLFVAVFQEELYTVTISGEHCVFEGAGSYHPGDTVTIRCIPDDHYRFLGWTGLGVVDAFVEDNPYTFVVEQDMDIIGFCEAIMYTLTVEASPVEGGTVTGGGEFEYASNVVISAVANEGYRFISWNDGDTNATRTVTVASDTTFTAIFGTLGIEQTDMSDVTIYANGNDIVVDGADGMTVRVFDALGRVAAVSEAKNGSLRIAVNATGIYLVQVGNAPARRVMVMR